MSLSDILAPGQFFSVPLGSFANQQDVIGIRLNTHFANLIDSGLLLWTGFVLALHRPTGPIGDEIGVDTEHSCSTDKFSDAANWNRLVAQIPFILSEIAKRYER